MEGRQDVEGGLLAATPARQSSGADSARSSTSGRRGSSVLGRRNSAANLRSEDTSFKARVHYLFDVPGSSKAATYMSIFIMCCIFASTLAFILESMPSLEGYTVVWMGLELFFVTVFSTEYVFRFYSTPLAKSKFFFEPFNLIDLMAILPFYLEIFLGSMIDLRVLRVIRLVRVFRLFKAGKYSTNLQLIVRAMQRSSEALVLLVFFLIVALILFGAVMFFTEQGAWNHAMQCYKRDGEEFCSPFESIPKSFYWGITTMTTVGYGDALPSTDIGKLICGLSMVFGILVIALPVTMIGNQFVSAYTEITHEMMAVRLEEEIQSEEEMVQQLSESVAEYAVLKSDCDELLPRLKHLLAASLVASERRPGAKEALQALEPSYDLMHRGVVQSISDIREYLKTVTAMTKSSVA